MIILSVLFSMLSWGSDCQLSENLNSFNIQCQSQKAIWQQINAHQAKVSIFLPKKLRVDLFFNRRLNGDYNISHMFVEKGLRANSWLTDYDHYFINKFKQTLENTDLFSSEIQIFQRSIDYVSSFPIYELLDGLVDSSRKKQINAGYKMICSSIGKRKRGYYEANGKKYSKLVRVGRKSTDCYGRCGSGCGSSSQYTQECLNHDVCNRTTGENLGVCSDEFWAASDGYFGAPNCQ